MPAETTRPTTLSALFNVLFNFSEQSLCVIYSRNSDTTVLAVVQLIQQLTFRLSMVVDLHVLVLYYIEQ